VGAGGTARALARIILGERGELDARAESTIRVSLRELASLTSELLSSTSEQRKRMQNVQKRRADLLPGGALVFKTVLEQLGASTMEVCDWGLREATILEALREAPPPAAQEPALRSRTPGSLG